MKKNITTYFKRKYKTMILHTKCFLLFIKNLIFLKTLKLRSVSIYDRIVIQDNEIEMLWNVYGCHKIIIKGIGVFAGNIHGIKFIFTNRQNPIEITFLGISKKTQKKIQINNTKINLYNKFITATDISYVIEVPYNKHKLECELSNVNLKMELENVYFAFEPINFDNYKLVNTIRK